MEEQLKLFIIHGCSLGSGLEASQRTIVVPAKSYDDAVRIAHSITNLIYPAIEEIKVDGYEIILKEV